MSRWLALHLSAPPPERHLPLAGVLFVRPRAASEVHHLLGVEVTLRGELELRPIS